MEFKTCLKKDLLDEIRTKKFLRNCLFALGMVLLSVIIFLVMNLFEDVSSSTGESDIISGVSEMFKATYFNYTMYFGTFMMTYFTIIYVVILRNTISKEIQQNKWLLPITAGIKPRNLILSKLIIRTLSVLIAEILAILVHFVTLLIFFEKGDFSIGQVMMSYLSIILFTLFMASLTISINAISKSNYLSAVLLISFLIVGTTILQSIFIGENALIGYTPFAFFQIATNPITKFNTAQWITASISYVAIFLGLNLWAIFSSKIKPIKTKK